MRTGEDREPPEISRDRSTRGPPQRREVARDENLLHHTNGQPWDRDAFFGTGKISTPRQIYSDPSETLVVPQ